MTAPLLLKVSQRCEPRSPPMKNPDTSDTRPPPGSAFETTVPRTNIDSFASCERMWKSHAERVNRKPNAYLHSCAGRCKSCILARCAGELKQEAASQGFTVGRQNALRRVHTDSQYLIYKAGRGTTHIIRKGAELSRRIHCCDGQCTSPRTSAMRLALVLVLMGGRR